MATGIIHRVATIGDHEMKLRLTLEELVWICQILGIYQDEHGKDYTAGIIIQKLTAYVGDIRVAPVDYVLLRDTEKLELLERVSEDIR